MQLCQRGHNCGQRGPIKQGFDMYVVEVLREEVYMGR